MNKENKLMELYPYNIADNTSENKKCRKKAIQKIIQAQYRQNTFQVLTNEVGKGKKSSLKRIQIQNENDHSTIQLQTRERIKNAIIEYNTSHFLYAYESKACKDKIYEKLKYDAIRDKVLRGEIEESDCDDIRVYEFLKLLKSQ